MNSFKEIIVVRRKYGIIHKKILLTVKNSRRPNKSKEDLLGRIFTYNVRIVLTFVRSTNTILKNLFQGFQCFGSGSLVAFGAGHFDLLHESADAADAGAIDLGPVFVATDALLGLRRIGHVRPCLGQPELPDVM